MSKVIDDTRSRASRRTIGSRISRASRHSRLSKGLRNSTSSKLSLRFYKPEEQATMDPMPRKTAKFLEQFKRESSGNRRTSMMSGRSNRSKRGHSAVTPRRTALRQFAKKINPPLIRKDNLKRVMTVSDERSENRSEMEKSDRSRVRRQNRERRKVRNRTGEGFARN